jgi:hypothetical protein
MNCLPTLPSPVGLQPLPTGCFTATVPLPEGGFAFAPTDSRDINASTPLLHCDGSIVGYVYPYRSSIATVIVTDCAGTTYGYAPSGNTVCSQPTNVECPDQSWSEGDFKYSVAGGCISRERISNRLVDGVFQHAVVTVSGGSVVMVTEGDAVAAVRPEMCVSQAASVLPGVQALTYLLESDPCNLLRVNTGGELSAYASVQPAIGSGVSVSGCGTQADPFIVGYTPPAITAPPVITNVLPGTGITVSVVGGVATISLAPNAIAVMPLLVCSGVSVKVYGSPDVTYTLGTETITLSPSGDGTMTTSFGGQVIAMKIGATLIGYAVMPDCSASGTGDGTGSGGGTGGTSGTDGGATA